MCTSDYEVVDMHFHVGLVGDRWKELGGMSKEYRSDLTFKIFLMYVRLDGDQVSDTVLKQRTLETIDSSVVDKVVCLALDPVYREDGTRDEDRSHMWVDNQYVVDLRKELPEKVLFGASVHPYDPGFEDRVKKCVDEGAVLVKWLPSAQQINLADDRVLKAMRFLATACPGGKPLSLLLHNGPEYAIPTTDYRTKSYDYLCWSGWDDFVNFLRFRKKWHKPEVKKIHGNFEIALREGAVIIFAHCGLPYFSPGILGQALEHSELSVVKDFLTRTARGDFGEGKCFADTSAVATPFRRSYFSEINGLPKDLLLFGSDFPTPVFELSADLGEMAEDFKAIVKGKLYRLVVPQDNLLDVNLREQRNAFPGATMFTNFSRCGFDRSVDE
jgi:predicted TIM-barrel fold metal-dependent hydrolase